jgi:DNA-binding beta-propeller fold protein YncE
MVRETLLISIAVVLAGCSGSPVADPFTSEIMVWPEPPETKRIAYVGEFSNSSELGFVPNAWGRFISFTAGSETDAMLRPMAVATSSNSRTIFVADPDARCVHRYDLDKGRYRCLMISRRERLISPIGLAASPDGRIYIADSQLAAIYQADIDENYLQKFETSIELEQPTGVAWDSVHQVLFVTDTGSQSIKVFDRNGTLVTEFGERGHGPGKFNFPTYLWFDPQDELLVTDSLNFRIQRFGDSGEFLHEFGENGDQAGYFARPKGIATDSFGHVYVIDALLNAMQVFNREGEILIAIGEQGQTQGQFWLPNGIFISGDNTIYIADSRNKRVQVFRYVGPEQ